MKFKYVLLPFLALSFFAVNAAAQDQRGFNPKDAEYLWPTEASSYLTSTFAETRSSHFHAALDIKTWGRRGYEVYATRDGIVDRVAIGPRGYGKVIYLKHDDGSYSVYAHLLSFNDELQRMIDSERLAQEYQFEIERFWGWKNIEIQKGDVIGYSGASGIGPPHLHFELRTPTHKPFNPLLTNLSVEDTISPQISGLSIEPLSPHSSINGNNKIVIQKPQKNGTDYEFNTTTVSGPLGLGIDAFDQSNGVNNTYAVYELSMSVDGQELFKARVDSFSYGETDQMFLDRIFPLLLKDKGGFQRLYIADGNTLPFYKTTANKGILDLELGTHTVSITATDFFGNSSTASLQLKVEEQTTKHPQTSFFQKSDDTHQNIQEPHNWNWFSNWLTLSHSQFQHITIASSDSSQFIQHKNGVAVDLSEEQSVFMNIPGFGPVDFRRITPKNHHIISSGDQQGFAIFPKNTLYDTVSVGMSVRRYSLDSTQVDLIPELYPVRDAFQFFIPRDSALVDTSKLAFYKKERFEDDEKWERIPTRFSNEYIIGEAESLGTFVTKKDTIPPKLDNPRIRQQPNGQWVLLIDATDNLSKIDYKKTRISVNDIRGIAEFEPEDNRFVYYRPDFTPSDSMQIDITAYDKEGNKNSSSFFLEN